MAESRDHNQFKLITTERNIVGVVGDDVTLPCHLSPETSAVTMTIRWFKETECIYLYKNGQVTERRGYEGRLSLITQEMERGNVSLRMKNIKESDSEDYICQVIHGEQKEEAVVGLRVRRVNHSELTSQFYTTGPELFYLQHKTLEDNLKRETSAELKLRKEIELEEMKQTLKEFEEKIKEKDLTLEEMSNGLKNTESRLEKTTKQLNENIKHFHEKDTQLDEMTQQVREKERQLENSVKEVEETNRQLENSVKEVEETKRQLETLGKDLQDKNIQVENFGVLLQEKDLQLEDRNHRLGEKDKQLEEREGELKERRQELEEKDKLLEKREKQLKEKEKQVEDVNNENYKLAQQVCDVKTEMERLRRETSTQMTVGGETSDTDTRVTHRRRNSMNLVPPTMGGESSSPASPVSPSGSELRLVLLGRTGAGRRAAGNTILGREEFGAQASPSAVTQRSVRREGEVCGRHLVLVDTPDWFCPGLSLEEMRQDVGLCVRLSAPGPHAFLLVIPVEPSKEEERGVLERMEEMFGEGCWGHTVILFTHDDSLKEPSIEEFLQAGSQDLQQVVEKYGSRYHVLNIKDRTHDTQVPELLEKIEEMVSGNRESFYCSQTYQETEDQVREMERKIQMKKVEKKQREERESRERFERELQESLNKKDVEIQNLNGEITILMEHITDLERQLEEERDEEKKKELESRLNIERERREQMMRDLDVFKEEKENEKKKMEEKHKQEIEEIREKYEGEARVEAERNLMKIVLPELQTNIIMFSTKMNTEFRKQIKEKDGQIEEKDRQIKEKDGQIEEKDRQIEEKDGQIETLKEAFQNVSEARLQFNTRMEELSRLFEAE
ncbi:golgin subfamily A member 4 [Esox lucius]|uniref:golgin subfamily A member 4 n=1 Tax=Esox lucius TaxID=8010 RepID=UPI00147780F8|nr:golgin subfamily A member 4 [Esox lucius]